MNKDLIYVIAVNSDGVIELLGIGEVTVDWRYDPKSELWSDITTNNIEANFGGESDA